jgi:hypothetical protein
MQHGKDREAAKQDLASASSVREKERSELLDPKWTKSKTLKLDPSRPIP